MDNKTIEKTVSKEEIFKFMASVFVLSPVEVIVKGHLLIEQEINQIIEIHLKEPVNLKNIGTKFASKLELAVAVGALTKEEKNALAKFNKIRNNVAHDVSYTIEQKDFDGIWSTLLKKQKELFTTLQQALKTQNYNVESPLVKMQLIIFILWLHLISSIRIGFPHKKELERLKQYYEYVVEEKKKHIEQLEIQNIKLQQEVGRLQQKREQLKQDTEQLNQEEERLKQKIEQTKQETKVYEEKTLALKKEKEAKDQEIIQLRQYLNKEMNELTQ
jgi:hypothetical protein